MPRECPPAFRNAPAVAGIGSAKRRSVRLPNASFPCFAGLGDSQKGPMGKKKRKKLRPLFSDPAVTILSDWQPTTSFRVIQADSII
jgi:hypothetical protein